MSKANTFYITTTLPYVNSDPHIGFAMEIVQADILVRAKKMQGFEVFFNTGTDEHGQKVYSKSVEVGKDTQEYVNEYADKFKELKSLLNLSDDLKFVRTTDEHHKYAAQEFWKKCYENGDIELKEYKVRYCVGCELEKTDSELVDDRCPIHPDKDLQIIEEKNYFFKFSNYGKKLLDLYDNNPDFLLPNFRLNEMKVLIEKGLEDFSVSRLKSKMPWGVPVPNDEDHIMYVWFDALVNYISTIGWPDDMGSFEKWWPVVQFAGKDQVRQQSAMWQAMLMSAGLPASKNIIIHGFINYEGQKMSKSLGNVINPKDLVDEYGVDALRYFIAREFNQFEDTDINSGKFKEDYNANLANGIGNLVARIMKMAIGLNYEIRDTKYEEFEEEYKKAFEEFNINKVADYVWKKIGDADKKIQDTTPFKLVKDENTKEEGERIIKELVNELYLIASMLYPFMPDTSDKIKDAIKENKMPENLFPRKD